MAGDQPGLLGAVVWIVGAGSGVGEATARLLAGKGARLVLTGRRVEALERVAGELSGDLGLADDRLMVLPGDMACEQAVAEAVDAIMARFGALDGLVNCAGTNIPERDLRRLSPRAVTDLLDGNLKSAFLLSLAVLPVMRARSSGIILHLSSWSARHFSATSGAAYTATKQGIVALCHTINMEEGGNGIRATAICPSEVNTGFLDRRPGPPDAARRRAMLQPADLAEAVLFVFDRRPGVCINELVISGVSTRQSVGPAGAAASTQISRGLLPVI